VVGVICSFCIDATTALLPGDETRSLKACWSACEAEMPDCILLCDETEHLLNGLALRWSRGRRRWAVWGRVHVHLAGPPVTKVPPTQNSVQKDVVT